ncbi:MAG: hypothetical protein WBA43_19125 [Elainellaceae cyanobacterium]
MLKVPPSAGQGLFFFGLFASAQPLAIREFISIHPQAQPGCGGGGGCMASVSVAAGIAGMAAINAAMALRRGCSSLAPIAGMAPIRVKMGHIS